MEILYEIHSHDPFKSHIWCLNKATKNFWDSRFLDTKKIRNLGWKPKYTIKEGIIKTIQYLESNQWLLNEK